jgi:hypothetical protein
MVRLSLLSLAFLFNFFLPIGALYKKKIRLWDLEHRNNNTQTQSICYEVALVERNLDCLRDSLKLYSQLFHCTAGRALERTTSSVLLSHKEIRNLSRSKLQGLMLQSLFVCCDFMSHFFLTFNC